MSVKGVELEICDMCASYLLAIFFILSDAKIHKLYLEYKKLK